MNALAPSPHDATRRSIFHVRFRLADGTGRARTVRCPAWERDPAASLIGLQARLATMTLDALIVSSSVSVPASPRHLKACIKGRGTPGHKCECFPRWTSISELVR